MGNATVQIFPQKSFGAIAGALALTVLAIGSLRLNGFEPASNLPTEPAEESRSLKFEDAAGGLVLVRDAKSGSLIKSLGVGEGAFVRATLRALVHDRQNQANTTQADFRLERHAVQGGHQLYLIDEATGRSVSLNAFGPGNTAAFAAFMSTQKGEGQ